MKLVFLLLLAQSADDLMLQGRRAMLQNDSDGACRAFQKAVELAPESSKPHFLLGFFYYVENDFVQARPSLERARQLAPKDAQAALFLALTYEGLALPVLAERMFQETIRLETTARKPNAETHTAYARFLFADGRMADAQAQVSRAMEISPNAREPHYEQARLHFERGDFTKCIAEAEQALTLQGDGVSPRQIHFLLSRAYSRSGDAERAAIHRKLFEAIPPRLVR